MHSPRCGQSSDECGRAQVLGDTLKRRDYDRARVQGLSSHGAPVTLPTVFLYWACHHLLLRSPAADMALRMGLVQGYRTGPSTGPRYPQWTPHQQVNWCSVLVLSLAQDVHYAARTSKASFVVLMSNRARGTGLLAGFNAPQGSPLADAGSSIDAKRPDRSILPYHCKSSPTASL
jgi:hypothetical protein